MTTRADLISHPNPVVGAAEEWRRGEFFAGLFALGCVSGTLTSIIIESIERLGWVDAFFGTFEISLIVWVSCIAGIDLILRDRTTGVHSSELVLGGGICSFL